MKMKHYLLGLVIFGIYVLSWIIQDNLFLNWDVGHLLSAAQLLLGGGSYVKDFFIPSPPAILHLYLPPILLEKFLNIDIILGFKIYIYLLISISLLISHHFLKKIFLQKDYLLFSCFFSVLAFSFLCLPIFEFGQRDHLLAVFSMPYLLAVAYRINSGKIVYNNYFDFLLYVLIGLWAAMGFVIKPQFLITPLFIESYFLWRKRSLLILIRPEIISMGLLIIFYNIFSIIIYPDYFFSIAPYLLQYYYQIIAEPWMDLLSNPLVTFFYLVIGMYFVINKKNDYQLLNTILLLSLVVFIFTYLSQRTTFYYHFVPAFTVALLLLTNLFSEGIYKKRFDQTSYMLMGLIAWASFVFLVYPIKNILFFICIFLAIGIIVFFLNHKNHGNYKEKIYWSNIVYKKNVLDKLILFMKDKPPHSSILSLSMRLNFNSPLIFYTKGSIAQRFDSMWMSGLIAKQIKYQGKDFAKKYIKNNKHPFFFINLAAEDLKKFKPDFVFVDDTHPNVRFLDTLNELERPYLNFIEYMLVNPDFHQEWQHYQYVTTIQNAPDSIFLFTMKIYQRKLGESHS
jgi:hypothetical protein